MASEKLGLINTAYTPLLSEDGSPRSRIHPYRPIAHPCRLCPGRCCRMLVFVSIPDAVRYCTELRLPFFGGLTVTASEHPTRSFKIDPDARYVLANEYWRGRGEIRLRAHEDGACFGLVHLGGYERCAVHAARPAACRTYPLSWQSESRRGGVEVVLCPLPYGVSPREEAQVLEDVQRSLVDWDLHQNIVSEWNQIPDGEPRTIERFLGFALSRFRSSRPEDELDPNEILDTRRPEERLHEAMIASRVTPSANPNRSQPGTQ